jgi:hypothetical protein
VLVIYSAKDTIYTLFIFCLSSVMGKRQGLTNPRRHCYGQEMRTNEPASPLLRARDEDQRTNAAFVMGKKICEITNRLHQKRHGLEDLQEFAKF